MAGFLTPKGKIAALNAVVGTAVSASTRYIGLAEALPVDGPPTLDTITEITVGGYARVAVPWNAPVTSSVDLISTQVTNSTDLTLGPVTADMPAAGYAFLTDAASGTTGDIFYVWELAEKVSALALKPILVPASALVIE